jgi:hypothetical protein
MPRSFLSGFSRRSLQRSSGRDRKLLPAPEQASAGLSDDWCARGSQLEASKALVLCQLAINRNERSNPVSVRTSNLPFLMPSQLHAGKTRRSTHDLGIDFDDATYFIRSNVF